METYIVTFSIDMCENLADTYKEMKETLEIIGNERGGWRDDDAALLSITKTTYLLSSALSKDSIRDKLDRVLKSNSTDGRILVMEVKLSGWSGHFKDEDEDMVEWIKKYVSLR